MAKINVNDLLKVLNNPFRRQILYNVAKYERIKYSDLMRLMNLDPTRSSGWFAYHLRLLIDVGLLKKEEENNFVYYSLSDAGKKTVLFLDEVGREMSFSYTIINFFERLSLFNQVEACWGLIFLLYFLSLIRLPLTYH